MNPPTRNRLTDSVAGPAMSAAGGDLLTCGRELGSEGGDRTQRDRARHHVAVHRAVFGGEIEKRQDPGAGIARDISGGTREGGGQCVGDRVVAVPEVLIEDLATNLGAADDVAHRQLVDRTLMRESERSVAKLHADTFGPGIDTLGACSHIRTITHFVDR